MLTIALAQTSPKFMDPGANLRDALRLIAQTNADLIVFPELFLSGYTFSTPAEVADCAMDGSNRYIEELRAASVARRIAICGGYAEAADERIYNSAFFIADGEVVANYRKTHLFYREHVFFSPGDTGFITFEYRSVRFGVMICFDWIYPESARTLALRGAQVILHPANLVLPYCQRAAFARAVENRVFLATANRVGTERNAHGDDLTFTGGSQVVDPFGEYLLEFDDTETGVKSVSIDPGKAADKSLNLFDTILGGRRPEHYG